MTISILLVAVVGMALVSVASADRAGRFSKNIDGELLVQTEEQAIEIASQLVPDGEVNFVHQGPGMWMISFDTVDGEVLVAVDAYTGEARIAPFEGRGLTKGCNDQEGEPLIQTEEQAVEIAAELVPEGEVANVHQGPCNWVVAFDTEDGKVVVMIDSYTGDATEGPMGKPGFGRGCGAIGHRGMGGGDHRDSGGFGHGGMGGWGR